MFVRRLIPLLLGILFLASMLSMAFNVAPVKAEEDPLSTSLSDPSTSVRYSDSVVIQTRLVFYFLGAYPLPNQYVYFYLDGNYIGTGFTDGSGWARLTYSAWISPGPHSLTVRYFGGFYGGYYYSETYTTGTLNVDKELTTLSDPSTSVVYSYSTSISTYLRDDEDNGVPGKTVVFSLYYSGAWQSIESAVTDSSGLASISYTAVQPPGTYPLKVDFAEDIYYYGSTREGSLTVSPPKVVPEFSLNFPIITSIATIAYLAIRKRIGRRLE